MSVRKKISCNLFLRLLTISLKPSLDSIKMKSGEKNKFLSWEALFVLNMYSKYITIKCTAPMKVCTVYRMIYPLRFQLKRAI